MGRPSIDSLPDGNAPNGITLPDGSTLRAGSVGAADQNESVPQHLRGVGRPDYIPATDGPRVVSETQTYLPAEYAIGNGQTRRDR